MKFFEFLGAYLPEAFCIFKEDGSVRHGTVFASVEDVRTWVETGKWIEGDTLHVVLNETDGRGRRRENIIGTRVYCVDVDSVVDRAQVRTWVTECGVEMVVESSPGKFHLYWRVREELKRDVAGWSKVQLALAGYFRSRYAVKADYTLQDITKNIRVPGFRRICKDGGVWMPKVVYCVGESEQGEGVRERFFEREGFVQEWSEYGQREWREESRGWRDAIKLTEAGAYSRDELFSRIRVGARNIFLYSYLKKGVVTGRFESLEDVLREGRELNGAFRTAVGADGKVLGSLEDREVKSVCESAWERGRKAYDKRQGVIKERFGTLGVSRGDRGDEENEERERAANERVATGECRSNGNGDVRDGDSLDSDNGSDRGEVGAGAGERSAEFVYDYTDEWLRTNRFSELAVAARIIQKHGKKICFVGDTVFAFDEEDVMWMPQGSAGSGNCRQLNEFYSDCVLDVVKDERFVEENAVGANGEVSIEKLRSAQRKFLSTSRFVSTTDFVKSSGRIKKMTREDFDKKLDEIFVGNGVLDLGSGRLRQPQAEDFLFCKSQVNWNRKLWERSLGENIVDGGGRREVFGEWEDFLGQVFEYNDDPELMVSYLQEVFGYTLTGYVREQKLFCHAGTGSNGKSKVLMALLALMGDYATIIESDELVKGKGKFVKGFERFGAKLEGKRLAVVDDLDVSTVWNEGFVKGATAERIRARGEYERSRDIVNRCKLHLGLNELPRPEAENYGLLRRIAIIPYERTFEPNAGEEGRLQEMIQRNLEAILVWAVEGYRRWKERGSLVTVKEIERRMDEYRGATFGVEAMLKGMFEVGVEIEGRGTTNTRHWAVIRQGSEVDTIWAQGGSYTGANGWVLYSIAEVMELVTERVKRDIALGVLDSTAMQNVTEMKVVAALRAMGVRTQRVLQKDGLRRVRYLTKLKQST